MYKTYGNPVDVLDDTRAEKFSESSYNQAFHNRIYCIMSCCQAKNGTAQRASDAFSPSIVSLCDVEIMTSNIVIPLYFQLIFPLQKAHVHHEGFAVLYIWEISYNNKNLGSVCNKQKSPHLKVDGSASNQCPYYVNL